MAGLSNADFAQVRESAGCACRPTPRSRVPLLFACRLPLAACSLNHSSGQIFATTTRKEGAGSGDGGGKRKEGGSKGGGGGGGGKKFKPYSQKFKEKSEAEASAFRDRAKERRLGTSTEYTISEEAVRSLTVEESKYLGGDMEHTHLVKGLDFALLAKIRAETVEEQDQRDEQLEAELDKAIHKVESTTLLGKTVNKLLLNRARGSGRKHIDMFLPGRTTFVFDLDDDWGAEIPTAVSRSLDDLKFTHRDKKTADISKTIMNSISTIMGYIRQGSKPSSKKRIKLKHGEQRDEKQEVKKEIPKPPAVVPDEDIFDDAGEYDLSKRAQEDIK